MPDSSHALTSCGNDIYADYERLTADVTALLDSMCRTLGSKACPKETAFITLLGLHIRSGHSGLRPFRKPRPPGGCAGIMMNSTCRR